MSEPKCRQGLNLDPMVQVTDKPSRLIEILTLGCFSLDTHDGTYNLSVG
jgi:hypothetical protein